MGGEEGGSGREKRRQWEGKKEVVGGEEGGTGRERRRRGCERKGVGN